MLSHYDLTQLAGIANTVKGSEVAGSRGYFLTGYGVLLNQALISYAVHFLRKRGFTCLQVCCSAGYPLPRASAAPQICTACCTLGTLHLYLCPSSADALRDEQERNGQGGAA